MQGKKSKNPDLKLLAGNPGKRPLPEAEEPESDFDLRLPEDFPESGRQYLKSIWPELKERGIIAAIDHAGLEMLGRLHAQISEIENLIDEHGAVVSGSKGQPLKNPLFTVLNQKRKLFIKLSEEFGLTPSSRQRLRTVTPKLRTNKYENWKSRKNENKK